MREDVLAMLRETADYFDDPSQGGDAIGSHACREAIHEITMLRKAVVRYGDRIRMANANPSELQQAIDRAFEFGG